MTTPMIKRWASAGLLAASFCTLSFRAEPNAPLKWSPKAAAIYLDDRQTWWVNWPESARDHQTFCVSCHTVVPYALARPSLRSPLGETSLSANEKKLLDNVTKRVNLWSDVQPFYSDEKVGVHKTPQSRGTESVLNALILSSYESANARPSPTLAKAFRNMWSEQLTTGDAKGSWSWLNFSNQPWEADDSPYFGATLAAIAIGNAPAALRTAPDVQPNIQSLCEYLQRHYAAQSRVNQLFLLWASTRLPDLLPSAQKDSLISSVLALQQQDGGWRLAAIVEDWKRHDGTPLETRSDGFATGVIAFILQQAGVPRENPQLAKSLAWLAANQDKKEGLWPSYSMNRQRDPSADGWLFMSDAATAYSVLALTQAQAPAAD